MHLENQVCSLELAKKMKELGFEQESLFYWRFSTKDKRSPEYRVVCGKKDDFYKHYSAYTVAELLEFFPRHITFGVRRKSEDRFINWAECADFQYEDETTSWAEGVAKTLIYLKENKINKPYA